MAAVKPVRHIRPTQPFSEWMRQLINRRETLWFFVWRDLKAQYQKPIFGLLWSVFQPLVYFGVILMVMHFSGRVSSISDIPFPLYLISGLAIWNFTTSAILGAVNSIQSNAGIIGKSFFPRIYLILSPILKSTLDLFIMLLIVVGLTIYFGQAISMNSLIFTPLSLILLWMSALGCSAIAASLVVANRHVRHAIPVLLYSMIFALPVFYSMNAIENELVQVIYRLNPIAGAMDCLRIGFGAETPHIGTILYWILESIALLGLGIMLFRWTEKSLADKV